MGQISGDYWVKYQKKDTTEKKKHAKYINMSAEQSPQGAAILPGKMNDY